MPDSFHFEKILSEAYAHIVGELRGSSEPARQAHARRLRHSPVPYHAFVLRGANGGVVACAQYALEADMAGLYDVFTAPTMRNRGLSCWLCVRLLAEARANGAKLAYLQVDRSNGPARAVYRSLGFADAHGYHYRAAPAAGA